MHCEKKWTQIIRHLRYPVFKLANPVFMLSEHVVVPRLQSIFCNWIWPQSIFNHLYVFNLILRYFYYDPRPPANMYSILCFLIECLDDELQSFLLVLLNCWSDMSKTVLGRKVPTVVVHIASSFICISFGLVHWEHSVFFLYNVHVTILSNRSFTKLGHSNWTCYLDISKSPLSPVSCFLKRNGSFCLSVYCHTYHLWNIRNRCGLPDISGTRGVKKYSNFPLQEFSLL